MVSGYSILWTDHALAELDGVFKYLEEHWTAHELQNLSRGIEHSLSLISKNPYLFPISEKNVRRVVILRFNTLYYRINNNEIEILSFFSNRQDPKKLKL